MFSQVFLAVTAREMEAFCPKRTAYMACHFSAGGKGLSNLPQQLPEDSILLLDDSMPVQDHAPETVVSQLKELTCRFSIRAVLLDFQRLWADETDKMVTAILQNSPCPVAVSSVYAQKRNCPVLLPPPPVNKSLQSYLQPWLKRGVFLEIAPEAAQFAVTKEGCQTKSVPYAENLPFFDSRLHCRYRVEVSPEKAVFTLCRTGDDLAYLSRQAYELGVLGTVGLYQELKECITKPHR